ncbi:flagellar filament capping protein FliD [Aromatoleum sp.]|uniref:flagellar filament capping protein FliD n=1 Tax=Aromatoleum sp. TaxID=2307007 RepID=UPI002FCC45FC
MAEINPTAMASQMATYYTQGAQDLIALQTKAATGTSSALTKLQSALQAFDSAVASLSGKKGLVQNTATFGAADFGSASATATAQPGSYAFFVEQLATAHQIAFEDLPAVPVASGGPITVGLADGSSFIVNLAAADQDADGTLSQAEVARAVNQAAGNGGRVSAMVMTVGTTTQLVLSAGATGAAGAISVDASALPAGALKDALSTNKELVAARDAIVWLGDQGSGTRLQQASNTFTSIPGVTMTFKRAMAAGESPVTLTVAGDAAGTASNVQSFVDAYNALMKAIGELTKPGSSDGTTAPAAFTTDSGVRMLRSKLNDLVRQDFGGVRLMDLGVAADRNGVLSLDAARLDKKLAAMPDALDQVFGSASLTAPSGLLGAMDQYLDQWLDTTGGQIKRRKDAVQSMQAALAVRQTRLDAQFESAYERYLAQFSRLEALMAQMSQTSGMFDMFAAPSR